MSERRFTENLFTSASHACLVLFSLTIVVFTIQDSSAGIDNRGSGHMLR